MGRVLPRGLRVRGWRGWLAALAALAAALAWQGWPPAGSPSGKDRSAAPAPPAPTSGQPYGLQGVAASVTDGDTLVLLVQGQRHRIRLASIDAPETGDGAERRGQPYGQAARRALSALLGGAQLQAQCYERDQYERQICDLRLPDGRNVNRVMVEQGMAWANRQGRDRHLRDRGLIALEQQARAARRGLWADAQPRSPWSWRYECWREQRC